MSRDDGATGGTVELTRQSPATSDVSTTLGDQTPTAVWTDLFKLRALQGPFIGAVREYATGETVNELYDALDDIGIPVFLSQRLRSIARGNERTAYRTAYSVSNLLDSCGLDDALAVLRLFEHVDVTPSVAVNLEPGFFDRRRDQREDICRILDTLANGADVTVYGSSIELRRLATDHRADLAGVSEWCNRSQTDSTVDAALDCLDRDGRPLKILHGLADEPGDTTTTSALYASATVSDSRVRQVLAKLSDVGCVRTYGSNSNEHVELTSTGREVLSETTRQTTLESAVSETTQSAQQSRVNPSKVEEGDSKDPYRTAYLDRPATAAAVGCGVDGAVTLVDDSAFGDCRDRTRYVSYLEDDDRAVVAVQASTPLQYAVSSATALASPEFFDRALPINRLDEIEEPAAILRSARCIGGVSAAAEDDSQVLRDTLVEWGNDLADMTRRLKTGEYENRNRLRRDILRSAHGLAGSIVHLLDAAGITLTREIRISGRLSDAQIGSLATTLSYTLAIQSRYESFAAFRQLYEEREEKRNNAFSVDVDAADPIGSLIGSVVIRSGAADRIGDILDGAVRHCFEVVEDAPEFAVSIPVRRAGTRAYQAVAARFGDRKRLKMDDAAVRTLAALTISPYAAAEALTTLGTEAMTRGINPDELRYALSTLLPNRLVDLPPTAQSMLSALLGAEAPLSQTELADVASCSTSSVRRHMPTLTALGICAETDVGYRCVLAFRDERGLDDWEIEGLTPRAGLDAVLSTQLPPHRYADPDDDLAGALWYPPTPWRVLEDPPPELARWINVSRMLIEPLNSSKNAEIDFETVSQFDFGEPTAQQPVTTANDDWSARPDPNRTTEI